MNSCRIFCKNLFYFKKTPESIKAALYRGFSLFVFFLFAVRSGHPPASPQSICNKDDNEIKILLLPPAEKHVFFSPTLHVSSPAAAGSALLLLLLRAVDLFSCSAVLTSRGLSDFPLLDLACFGRASFSLVGVWVTASCLTAFFFVELAGRLLTT